MEVHQLLCKTNNINCTNVNLCIVITVPTTYDTLKTSPPAPLPTVIERLPENHNTIATSTSSSNNNNLNTNSSPSNNSGSLKLEEVSSDTSNLLVNSESQRQSQESR